MLLGEPAPTQGDLNFALFRIPVRVHPFFWLIAFLLGPWRSPSGSPVVPMLTWIVALFVSILLHEFGHAMAMRAYGFRPSITLYGLGGLTSYNHAGSSGSRSTGPLGQILISLAGPGAGFLLAAVLALGIILAGHGEQLYFGGPLGVIPVVVGIDNQSLAEFINNMFFICVLWGLVNLMPIYPLDGGQIAREILVAANPRQGIRQSLILSIIAAAALALIGLTQWKSLFVALLFGYLAYSSYATLQAYTGRRSW